MPYTEEDLLRVARRIRNAKRGFLLVNPLQGKHIPVSPTASLAMMEELGRLAAEKVPPFCAVLGFAETATAIGTAVAAGQPGSCFYVHTTREHSALKEPVIRFEEEHSHAVSQYLCVGEAEKALRREGPLAVVDDELTTGKTLLNVVREIRGRFPFLADRPVCALSVINRLDAERLEALRAEGITCLSLLRPFPDREITAPDVPVREAEAPEPSGEEPRISFLELPALPEARRGVETAAYLAACRAGAETAAARLDLRGKRVVALGTEECMTPALVLGRMLEKEGAAAWVRCHATTRSPIGISDRAGYPMTGGVRLPSFYEAERVTYLYNLRACDQVVVWTDTPDARQARRAAEELWNAFAPMGCGRITIIRSV